MERTTLTLDSDLARALRQQAHDSRRPFKDVVNEAIRGAQEGGVEARGDGGVRAVGHGGEWPTRSTTKVVPLGRLVSIGQATQ